MGTMTGTPIFNTIRFIREARMRSNWLVRSLGVMIIASISLFGCKSAPQAELDDAESALLAAAVKKDCAQEQYLAAEKLLAEAHQHVEDGDYDAAERKAIAAQRLANEAREYAEANWEDCQRRIAEAQRDATEEDSVADDEDARGDSGRRDDERGTGELVTVYFPYNSSEIADQSREAMEANIRWMRENPDVRVRLEGHTDIRGTAEYNMALGQRRANFVRNYLAQRGIERERMQILSYGQELLVSQGVRESDHAQNRRVEFVPVE